MDLPSGQGVKGDKMRAQTAIRICAFVSLLGCLLFAALLWVLQKRPDLVDAQLQRFAVYTVERGVRDTLETPDGDPDTLMARLSQKYATQAELLRKNAPQQVPKLVAAILGDRCQLACADAEEIGLTLVAGYAMGLEIKGKTLQDFVNEKYDATVTALRRDLKIFALVNTLAFSLVLVLCALRKDLPTRPLLNATLILTASVLIGIGLYVFGQDWVSAILLNRFVGWVYLVWIGLLIVFFIDLAFLRLWLTQTIVGSLIHMLTLILPV